LKSRKILILVLVFTLITALLPSCIFTAVEGNSSAVVTVETVSSNVLNSTDEINSSISTVSNEPHLEVCFLDVGQADCILITTPEGKYILIDSGDLGTKDEVKNFLTQKGVKEIEYAFFTHPHADHIGAADVIIKNFIIKNVYMPNATATTQVYARLLDALEENESVNVVQALAGQNITLDDLSIEILSPSRESYDEMNLYSITIRITYGENEFLFMGDAEILNEEDMLKSGVNLDADVLKVGHHGSSSSTSIDFLTAVSPDIAVISCGVDNDYGHPASSTLEKLIGITTYRTDTNGTITLNSDGTEISVITSK